MARTDTSPNYSSAKIKSDDHEVFRSDAEVLDSNIMEVIAASRREWESLPLRKKVARLRQVREASIQTDAVPA